MLTAAYNVLRDGIGYRDLGASHFDRHERARTINRLLRRLHDLGCPVMVAVPAS
jgi:adenylylsulfate kinase-like enzyme